MLKGRDWRLSKISSWESISSWGAVKVSGREHPTNLGHEQNEGDLVTICWAWVRSSNFSPVIGWKMNTVKSEETNFSLHARCAKTRWTILKTLLSFTHPSGPELHWAAGIMKDYEIQYIDGCIKVESLSPRSPDFLWGHGNNCIRLTNHAEVSSLEYCTYITTSRSSRPTGIGMTLPDL